MMADKRRIEGAKERPDQGEVSHRWRIHPAVDKELEELGDEDAVSIHAQMLIVRQDGLRAARHLVEDIYEVEAHGVDNSYRLLFSTEGAKGRILLAMVLHEKHTQKTPKHVIELARDRRDRWRAE
jgi:phage-related protein